MKHRLACLLAGLAFVAAAAALHAVPYQRPAHAIKMPEFSPGLPWFNVAQPLSIAGLKGKMVLLDFWTYG